MRFLRMAEKDKPWYLRTATRWTHFRAVPFKRLWVLMAAVFVLFSVIGFYADLNAANGEMPYVVAFAIAFFCGVNAVLWIVVLARLSRLFLIALIAMQFFSGAFNTW